MLSKFSKISNFFIYLLFYLSNVLLLLFVILYVSSGGSEASSIDTAEYVDLSSSCYIIDDYAILYAHSLDNNSEDNIETSNISIPSNSMDNNPLGRTDPLDTDLTGAPDANNPTGTPNNSPTDSNPPADNNDDDNNGNGGADSSANDRADDNATSDGNNSEGNTNNPESIDDNRSVSNNPTGTPQNTPTSTGTGTPTYTKAELEAKSSEKSSSLQQEEITKIFGDKGLKNDPTQPCQDKSKCKSSHTIKVFGGKPYSAGPDGNIDTESDNEDSNDDENNDSDSFSMPSGYTSMTFTDTTWTDSENEGGNNGSNNKNNNNSNNRNNGENDDPKNIRSPLDQFQIRILFTFFAPALGFMRLSLTNMGLFLTISTYINWTMTCMIIGTRKILTSKWYAGLESMYTTVYSIVINQINNKTGQIFFPFMYILFTFILVNNLIGMIPYCFSSTSHFILGFLLSFTVVIGCTIIGIILHKLYFWSLFVPSGCPKGLLLLLVLIELISYLARNVSLGLRLAANILSGHMLLNILSGFTYDISKSNAPQSTAAIVPFAFIGAFTILEIGISFIQSQVFTVLGSSYLGDGVFLH